MANTRKEFKVELFNSLKDNDITVVVGGVGVGKLSCVIELAEENSLEHLTIRLPMLDKGDLDTMNLIITKDTILIIDDLDRVNLTLECEINRFIHRAKNLKTEFNVYICGIMSNKDNDLSEVLNEIIFEPIDYEVTIDDYLEYMGDKLIPEIKEFIKAFPIYFNSFDATPKNWSRLSEYLKNRKLPRKKTLKEISHMFIGLSVSKELIKFNYGRE